MKSAEATDLALERDGFLSVERWTALVGVQRPEAPEVALLHRASELADRRSLTSKYLYYLLEHLDGGAVDFDLLEAQIAWLQPLAHTLTAEDRTRLQIAEEEAGNHCGHADVAGRFRFREDRYAPMGLILQTDLVRAVRATNAFQFDAARAVLETWLDREQMVRQFGRRVVELDGQKVEWTAVAEREDSLALLLGYRPLGRLWSAWGQLDAFQGQLGAAAANFRAALAAFSQVPEGPRVHKDRTQTQTYLVIALMDDPRVSDDEVTRELLHLAQVETLSALFEKISAGNLEHSLKYLHHTTLRYLVHRGQPVDGYLGAMGDRVQDLGAGHPWHLIALYRALMLYPTPLSLDLCRRAYLDAVHAQSGALFAIARTIQEVARRWGEVIQTDGDDVLESALPVGARPYVAAMTKAEDVLGIVKSGLPFNFR